MENGKSARVYRGENSAVSVSPRLGSLQIRLIIQSPSVGPSCCRDPTWCISLHAPADSFLEMF